VIGKKSVKLSVERNRLKRQIRESYRHSQEALSGWDIVVVARKGLGDLENAELAQQFSKLWKRLARSKTQPVTTASESSSSASKNQAGVVDSPHA
jgi:ribonuclease P protein component